MEARVTRSPRGSPPARKSTGPADPRDEIAPYRRSFLIAALLTLPVFVAEMGGHLVAGLPSLAADDLGETPLRLGNSC
jgi:Cu+-exporting ATPase